MPATIELSGGSLVVHIEGADRLWALKSRLEIPLENVVYVEAATAESHKRMHGIRVGGTHIPGVISAGRFRAHGEWVFWDVHDADKAIEIVLRDERYNKLVIEVADPEREIRRVREALGSVLA